MYITGYVPECLPMYVALCFVSRPKSPSKLKPAHTQELLIPP